MRNSDRLLIVGALGASLVALPALPEAALRPMQVTEQRVALAFAAEDDGTWVSEQVDGETTIAGLTWDNDVDPPQSAEVRVLADGDWTAWESVEIDDEHAPDPDSAENLGARSGTAPVVVEGADAVQFRVTGDAPRGLTADLIDVDDPDAARRGRSTAAAAAAAPTRPAIRSRADWNADGCVQRDPDDIEYGERVQVLFVHHTAGNTSYSQSQVAGIMRSICSYHVNSRGWSDIGYNTLIDAFGGIWEGRAGGLDKSVIGAHTGGFNSHSTGVAFIGDHSSAGPTPAAQSALASYAAWKLDVHNLDPEGSTTLVSGGSSRWSSGKSVALATISGHRDASATACPGTACYVLLPNFITQIEQTGDFKIYGGWPAAPRSNVRADGSWTPVSVPVSFSDPADWTLEIRSPRGTVVHRESGAGDGQTVTWAGTANGQKVPPGTYTITVQATQRSNGAVANPSVHEAPLGPPLGQFDDVDPDSTFADDIAWLAKAGITQGCNPPDNTHFCPTSTVTRAQMATFLSRALSLRDGTAQFNDVPPDHLHHADIARLANAGITRGCNTARTKFCPDDGVTRAEMAAFLVRARGLNDTDHPGFEDVPASSTFHDDIRRLAAAGVTRGCNPPNNTRYCPDQVVTRGQMAAFLRRSIP
jgi:hypothetical protein